MSVENFIIHVFIFVDDFLKTIGKIRKSGPGPDHYCPIVHNPNPLRALDI
jgi:hypothetical protein